MSNENKNLRSKVFTMAWQFIKRNGYSLSEALTAAWANVKLRAALSLGIVRFYFRKVDGTLREAFGTLSERIAPQTQGNDSRRRNDTVQTYYDTERQEWRCFKKANLVRIG